MTESHISSQKRLKILHLVYDHPDNPWCGGGGALRTWAINSILARRHDITVYCGAFPKAKVQNQPFRVCYLGRAKNYKESRLKYIFNSRQIDCQPYDLIVEDFSAFSPSLVKCNNKPLISTVHYYLGLSAFRYRPILGIVAYLSEQMLLRRRKLVILVSEHLKKALHPHTKSIIISPGIDIPSDLPSSAEDYVLFLGRLDIKIKGLDILIKAWAQLSDDKRALPLYIGGGGDQTKVQEIIRTTGAKGVHFLGHLDHKDAMAAIKRAAFLCVPSRMEGCGIVLYEALALGKPVIASSIPSFKNILNNNVNGLLVPPGDPKSLSIAIASLLKNEELRRCMAKEACKSEKEFSWESAAEKQAQFYSYIQTLKKN